MTAPSVARGTAYFSVVVALVVAVSGFRRMTDRARAPQPACIVPVQVGGDDTAVLGCAEEMEELGCGLLLAGDRIEVGALGCRRHEGGMAAGWRLGLGLGLDVNRVSAADLELIGGVGPVLAGAIVAHRIERGRYQSMDELLEVTGIGPRRLASLGEVLFVGARRIAQNGN